jgi:hypothetical protein
MGYQRLLGVLSLVVLGASIALAAYSFTLANDNKWSEGLYYVMAAIFLMQLSGRINRPVVFPPRRTG